MRLDELCTLAIIRAYELAILYHCHRFDTVTAPDGHAIYDPLYNQVLYLLLRQAQIECRGLLI